MRASPRPSPRLPHGTRGEPPTPAALAVPVELYEQSILAQVLALVMASIFGAACPCPIGVGATTDKKRLVEMSPFSAGSDSDAGNADEGSTPFAVPAQIAAQKENEAVAAKELNAGSAVDPTPPTECVTTEVKAHAS